MKKFFAAWTMFFLMFCSQQASAQATTPCSYASGVLQSASLIFDGQISSCYTTPQTARLIVHEIRLCEQEPSTSDYLSVCEPLVSSSAGRSVEIGVSGAPVALGSDLSLPTAEFQYAAIVFSNEIGLKHTETFDTDQTGYLGSTGPTCATRLVTASEAQGDSYVTCGTSPNAPTAEFLTEAIYQVDQSAACGAYDPNGLSGDVKFCLLSDRTTLASAGQGGLYSDTEFIFAVQRFSTPVSISELTRELTVAFGITDMLSIEDDGSQVSYFLSGLQLSVSSQ